MANTLDPGPWTLDPGNWSPVSGPWSLDSWSLVSGPWTLDPGVWYLDLGLMVSPWITPWLMTCDLWSVVCDLDNTMACDLNPWSVTLAHMVCGLWTWVCDLVSGL